MKKQILITISLILLSFISISKLVKYNYPKSEEKSNNKIYSIYLDDKKISSFPSKGLFKVTVNCKNAQGKWIYDDWKLTIEDIIGDVSCNINFKTIQYQKFNNHIISLLGKKQGEGQFINENGYRYEGKNPNNYVLFNNEYWRIIGVFDSNSHGQNGEQLIKMIRDEQICTVVWDKSSYKTWDTSTLYNLLNDNYYNATDGTNSGYCYGYYENRRNAISNCNYTKVGIQDYYRTMVKKTTWFLGKHDTYTATANELYNAERIQETSLGMITKVDAKIGLMYPSDYGYSSLKTDCPRTTSLHEYSDKGCASKSWLYKSGKEWLITSSDTTNKRIFNILPEGDLYYLEANYGMCYRPVLYLDSSVYLIEGEGTLDKPYIVGI